MTDLPDPLSPTNPITCPALHGERDVVHRPDHARPRREMRRQPADIQRRRHRRSFGFKTSRNWSPTKLIATIVSSSAIPGKKLIQYLPDSMYW